MSYLVIDVKCRYCENITRDMWVERRHDCYPDLMPIPCPKCGKKESLLQDFSETRVALDKESLAPKDHIYNVEIEHRDSSGKKHRTKLSSSQLDQFNKGK